MKKILLAFASLSILSFCCCTPGEVDLASQATGIYQMIAYETQLETSNPTEGDVLIVTREDDTHLQIVIDYNSENSDDVTLTNIMISKSGGDYFLERMYNNANVDGLQNGGDLMLNINYDDGNFVLISATK